jgi:hypothetical protein
MVMMPYNATWRNIRKLMHQVGNSPNLLMIGFNVARGREISTFNGKREYAINLGIFYQSSRMVST